jgi:uncharacterized protein YjbJ (UPF0337 family)
LPPHAIDGPDEKSPLLGWTDKLKKKKDETKGTAKKQLGKATDDEQMERKGQIDQTKSNLKQAGEKVKDALNKD